MDEEQRLEMSGEEYDPFGEWIPDYSPEMDSLDDIPSREDIIGEILDTGESMELLPDMVEEILRDMENAEDAFEEEYEDPAGFDAEASRGNQNSSSFGFAARNDSRSNDTYSKINRSVDDVKVSPEIIDRIKTEITEEIIKQGLSPEHMDVLVADRIKDKVEELKGIRANIEHYSDLYTKMSQSSNPMHLRSMTTFQLLRFEIDSACRDYVKAGGAVGKDCFIEKGVSASQIGLSLIDVVRTNALESAIIRGATGINIGYDDIYGGITGEKSIMGKISFPFVKLADVIGEKPGSILHDIFEKMDAKPDIEKAEEKDDPDIQKNAVVSEAEAEVSMETETGIQSDIEQLADDTTETPVEQPEQDEQVSNENNADEIQSVSEEQKSVAEEEEKEPVSVEEESPVNDNSEDDTDDDTDSEDSKRDSDNALITADDEENDAQIEDDEDKESDDKSEDTEAESPEHITNEDGLDIHDPDELSAEAAEQNEDLEDSSDLAIEQKLDDADETDEESVDSEPADADEQAEEIVDSAVKAVEEGEPEENVLSEVSEKLADFYEKQTEDPDLSLEDIVDSIADAVHEIASVFDDPVTAADTMLEGIPDDAVKADILDRIDEVHADMTVEASGSFGNIEYDDTGKVTEKVETDAPMEQVDTSSFDLNSMVDALEDHMESAWELPEMKDVVANDPDTMLEVPTGDEFAGSIGMEDLGGAASGAVTDSGIEAVPELIELFL